MEGFKRDEMQGKKGLWEMIKGTYNILVNQLRFASLGIS